MRQWIKYGKIYGYPECCIEAFVERNIDDNNIILPNRIQKRISKRTGFIPCSYCCWKVLSNQCKLEGLIKNRKEKLNFPQDRMDVNYYRKK